MCIYRWLAQPVATRLEMDVIRSEMSCNDLTSKAYTKVWLGSGQNLFKKVPALFKGWQLEIAVIRPRKPQKPETTRLASKVKDLQSIMACPTLPTNMHVCFFVCRRTVHICIHLYVRMYVHMRVCMYACTHACMYVCVYVSDLIHSLHAWW